MMTHFYIDVIDGQTKHFDQVGSDLPTIADAREEAVIALCDLMRHHALTREQNVLRASIRNASGAIVYESVLTFAGITYE